MGLHLAGIDLRHTPEDEWYCFEVNPSPAFPYYEQWTDQPIASTLAQLLIAGTRIGYGSHPPEGAEKIAREPCSPWLRFDEPEHAANPAKAIATQAVERRTA